MTDEERLSVRVGVGISPLGPSPEQESLWGLAELLEEVGYDSIWLSDSPLRAGSPAPLPTLAAIAARTEQLKLGTNVLVLPHRNPVVLARELATVDVLSGGRLLPAGGLGIDLPGELEATGVDRSERGPRAEESLAVIKALWGGAPVTHRGSFWSLTDVTLSPAPTRRKLEFWLGGRAPAALRRIGRAADGWLASFVSPAEFGAGIAIIRDAAAEAGRSIDADHYGTLVFSAPSADELPPPGNPVLDRRRDLDRADHVAAGLEDTRALLDRFIERGASKFVLMPVARDPGAWLRELFGAVIEPLESAGAPLTEAIRPLAVKRPPRGVG